MKSDDNSAHSPYNGSIKNYEYRESINNGVKHMTLNFATEMVRGGFIGHGDNGRGIAHILVKIHISGPIRLVPSKRLNAILS